MHHRRNFLALVALSTAACSSIASDPDFVWANREMTERTFPACQPRTNSHPRLVTGKAPIYPISRVMAEEDGHAILEFDVTERGRAENFKMIESSKRIFYTHTRIAVSDWIFEPAIQDDVPITVRCKFRQDFIIK